jgi:hypothetical protein
MRLLIVCVFLGGFVLSQVPLDTRPAEAAQTVVKKKKKDHDQKKVHKQVKKKYPWGEPNAGWSDRCIFYYDAYDGWIPPFCRPFGRTY